MKVLTAAICDRAGTLPDGKLDLQGVFHDLYAPGFPAKQGEMTLALMIEWDRGDEGRYQFRIDMVGPSGKPGLTVEGHSDVSDPDPTRPPPRTQLVMPMKDVVFPEAGEYRFELKMKGQTLPGPTLYLMETREDEAAAPTA